MTEWPNAYGKPSLDDLDESWHRYLAADREEQKKMNKDMVTYEAMGCGCLVVIVGGALLLGALLCLFE